MFLTKKKIAEIHDRLDGTIKVKFESICNQLVDKIDSSDQSMRGYVKGALGDYWTRIDDKVKSVRLRVYSLEQRFENYEKKIKEMRDRMDKFLERLETTNHLETRIEGLEKQDKTAERVALLLEEENKKNQVQLIIHSSKIEKTLNSIRDHYSEITALKGKGKKNATKTRAKTSTKRRKPRVVRKSGTKDI